MKSFQFSLESVLRWRTLQHSQEEEKLKQLLARRYRLEQEMREVEEAKRDAVRTQLQDGRSANGSDFQMTARYLVGLQAKQARLEKSLKESSAAIQRQRAECVEAQRRVDLMDSLKGRRSHAWLQERDRELESLAADAYLAKFTRER